jgi:hypothetical protein
MGGSANVQRPQSFGQQPQQGYGQMPQQGYSQMPQQSYYPQQNYYAQRPYYPQQQSYYPQQQSMYGMPQYQPRQQPMYGMPQAQTAAAPQPAAAQPTASQPAVAQSVAAQPAAAQGIGQVDAQGFDSQARQQYNALSSFIHGGNAPSGFEHSLDPGTDEYKDIQNLTKYSSNANYNQWRPSYDPQGHRLNTSFENFIDPTTYNYADPNKTYAAPTQTQAANAVTRLDPDVYAKKQADQLAAIMRAFPGLAGKRAGGEVRAAIMTAKRLRGHYDDGGTPVAKKNAAPVQVAAAPAAEVAAAPAADTSTTQAPGVSQADIENLYKTVANRSSDPEGMAYWQQQAANGMSLDQMQAQFQQAAQDPLQQAKTASMEDVGAVKSYGDNIPQPPKKPLYLQEFDFSKYDNPLDAQYAFLAKTFNPTIAAGSMGNFNPESYNSPSTMQNQKLDASGNVVGNPIFDKNNLPTGYGLAQWGGVRLTNNLKDDKRLGLFDWANKTGFDPNTTEGQTRFMVYELTENPQYQKVYNQMLGAGNDVNKVTQIFGSGYENPNALNNTLEDRQASAQMYYNNYNNPSALTSADQTEIAQNQFRMQANDPAFQQYAAKKAADAATAAAAAAAQKTTTSTDTPIDMSVIQPTFDQTGVTGNQDITNMLNSNSGTDFLNFGLSGLNTISPTITPSSGGVPGGEFHNGISIVDGVMQNFGLDPSTFACGGTVHHALRLAHRYARGGYADGGPLPDDSVQTDDNVQPGDSLLMRERQTITPSSLARSWTPPEETIEANYGPRQREIMENYPEALAQAPEAIAHHVANTVMYPGQVLYNEKPYDPAEAVKWADDASGMIMTGGLGTAALIPSATKDMSSTTRIFAGPMAKTADLNALDAAKKLAEAGVKREDIIDKTGWFQGADKKWRFEIPDNTSYADVESLAGEGMKLGSKLPLNNVFSHNPLYKAYPEIAATDVRLMRSTDPFAVSSGEKYPLFVSLPEGSSDKLARAKLTHEAQHLVQRQEGFAEGANPKMFQHDETSGLTPYEQYRRSIGEVEARNVERRKYMTPEERQRSYPWATEDVPVEQQIVHSSSAPKPEPQMGLKQHEPEGYLAHDDPSRKQNFENWFGDSVVKNQDGTPKTVYHGSGADFSVFRPSKTGEFGPGVYATDLADEASSYAGTHPEGMGQNVMPVHIRMEQPFVAKNPSDFWDAFGGKTDTDAMLNAQKAGYDGVIIERPYTIYDDKRKQFYQTGQTHTHYVVFDPKQIKSAIGNKGTYDLKSPKITEARGGTIPFGPEAAQRAVRIAKQQAGRR